MKVVVSNWNIENDAGDIVATVDFFNGAYDVHIKESRLTKEEWSELASLISKCVVSEG